jgi:hypothetical protein
MLTGGTQNLGRDTVGIEKSIAIRYIISQRSGGGETWTDKESHGVLSLPLEASHSIGLPVQYRARRYGRQIQTRPSRHISSDCGFSLRRRQDFGRCLHTIILQPSRTISKMPRRSSRPSLESFGRSKERHSSSSGTSYQPSIVGV